MENQRSSLKNLKTSCEAYVSLDLSIQVNKSQIHLVTQSQGFTKRCRLSWLTNSALVYEPKCGGGVSANEYSCAQEPK
jgi:hypothetical protein